MSDAANSWVFLVFAAAAVALAILRHTWLLRRSHRLKEGCAPKAGKLQIFTKRYLLMPAIFHATAHRPTCFGLTWSLPTRMHSIAVLLLVLINAIACGWGLDAFSGNIYFDATWLQYVRYVADRTGMYAVYNMPLLFAFAGRNNILIWLTGSSFETFNVYHRWIGRIVVGEAVVHSVLYTW
jgi:hypothetical protein